MLLAACCALFRLRWQLAVVDLPDCLVGGIIDLSNDDILNPLFNIFFHYVADRCDLFLQAEDLVQKLDSNLFDLHLHHGF